jgi:hypothetical protein
MNTEERNSVEKDECPLTGGAHQLTVKVCFAGAEKDR